MSILPTNDIARMADFFRASYGDKTDDLLEALLEPRPKIAVDGLLGHYFVDPSSVFPALLLPLAPDMKVLDMCAAPGGKLLVMLSRMIKNVQFFANDISRARSWRLRRVVKELIPPHEQANIHFYCRDATYFGLKYPGHFDAVLLDTPCSSEGHVVKNPNLLKKFSPKKNLVIRQYSLLCAALLALKPGGHVMYATCSINKEENEGVIKTILRKKNAQCALIETFPPYGLKNEFGVSILPHLHKAGPAFFSLLRRL